MEVLFVVEDFARSRYPNVSILFLGGAGDRITGSLALLKIAFSTGEVKYGLIECGGVQGETDSTYDPLFINSFKIDFVILTHAHFDHVGALPMLYENGFNGKIYCTSNTAKLMFPILVDAEKISASNGEVVTIRTHRKVMRLIEAKLLSKRRSASQHREMQTFDSCLEEAEEIINRNNMLNDLMILVHSKPLFKEFEICPGVKCRFIPTTHQNGAIRAELTILDTNNEKYCMAFSGDVGPRNSLLYRAHDGYCNEKTDCLLLETIHGVEEPEETLEESTQRLYEIIKDSIRHRKHVILVGFSLDRNAMLVYLMNKLKKSNSGVELLIDSPLTLKELRNYQLMYNSASENIWFKDLGKDPFSVEKFRVIKKHSDHICEILHGKAPRVIITSSANGNGGRVVDYFINGIQREDFVFVFCGWTYPTSPSTILHKTAKNAICEMHGRRYVKKCTTYHLLGFSSHGYYNDTLDVVNSYPNVSTIILNHAATQDKENVAERLLKTYDKSVLIPELYEAYSLFKGGMYKLMTKETTVEFGDVMSAQFFAEN